MTQPNFPDGGDNYRLERRSFIHTEIDPESELNPVARKFATGMFITAILASSGFVIYLFNFPGTTPKVSPTDPPLPPVLQSPSVSVVEG
jgi:hypothetical protein